jgi:hypothetical protein
MTTRLNLYNDALILAGERALGSLSEDVESRRLLDQVWNSNGVNKCLEEGQWHFAMRTVMVDYDPAISPGFGYRMAFTKPDDWVLTSALCSDEFFREPLLEYWDEAGYWYADLETIYVRYVSNDVDYGLDLNKWPDSFEEFVAAHFASRITLKLSGDESRWKAAIAFREQVKKTAKNKAAMAEPSLFPAQGSWTRARLRGKRGDRGNTSGDLY